MEPAMDMYGPARAQYIRAKQAFRKGPRETCQILRGMRNAPDDNSLDASGVPIHSI